MGAVNSFWLNFLAVLQLDCTLYPTLKAQSPNLLEGQGSPLSMEYFYSHVMYLWASQVVLVVKNLPASAGDIKRYRFDPWIGKVAWRRKWQLFPVFMPGESHYRGPVGLQSIRSQRVAHD